MLANDTANPEVNYYQTALAIAIALLTGRLELAMLATYDHRTRFVHTTIDQVVVAARNGWSVVVYAVPPDLRSELRLDGAIDRGAAYWLGDYNGRQPACGDLLWLLHTQFTGETPPAGIHFIPNLLSPWSAENGRSPLVSHGPRT